MSTTEDQMVPAGHSVDPVRWQGELDALLGRGAAVPDPCPAMRCTSCHVRGAAARPTPVATLMTGGREAAGGAAHLSGREAAVDTSMAMYTGHWPSGRRSFQKQRTVNPPIVPARYNFLYTLKAGPAGGRLRRPSSRRQRHAGHGRRLILAPSSLPAAG